MICAFFLLIASVLQAASSSSRGAAKKKTRVCGIAAMRNQHRVYQTTARPNTKLPLKTLLTSHLHLVIAAAVESYTLVTRTTLPFAVSLVVKACWLWEFHLRAEEATFGARILIQWCYHLAVAFALLPATGAAILT